MNLSTLIKKAQQATSFRGHRMKWEKKILSTGTGCAIGTCKCGAQVQCLTNPDPNQIDIGGDAVAINCDSK